MTRHSDTIGRRLTATRTRRGVAVTYVQTGESGDPETAITKALKTKPTRSGSDAKGAVHTVQADDWLIGVADLPALPQRDDLIRYVTGGETRTYKVLPINGTRGEACFRYSDAGESQVRIHTKLTKTE